MGVLEQLLQQVSDEVSPESTQNTTPESRAIAAQKFRRDLDERPEYKHLTATERAGVLGILDAVDQEIALLLSTPSHAS